MALSVRALDQWLEVTSIWRTPIGPQKWSDAAVRNDGTQEIGGGWAKGCLN